MDNLEKLGKMLDLVDTKSSIEEFVTAFGHVVDLFEQMKTANEKERADIKQLLDSEVAKLRERVAQIKNGRDGIDGVNGLDGRDGQDGKDGVPGKDGENGLPGSNGENGSPDTPDQIIEKVNQSSLLILPERVQGLLDAMRNIAASAVSVGITTTNFLKNGSFIGRAKNINIIEGSSISANLYQTGDQMNISITSTAAGSGTTVAEEVPSGTIDGNNVTFTIAHTPQAGTLKVYLNGARQQNTIDYTLSGTTITFTYAPTINSTLFVDYVY